VPLTGGAFLRHRHLLSDGSEHAGETEAFVCPAGRGGIHDLTLWPVVSDSYAPLTLEAVEVDSFDPDTLDVFDTIRFVNVAGPNDVWLGWVSRCGGFEHWNFVPTPDEAQKRTPTLFTPADGTTRVQRVDLTQTQRFYSRLLSKAQWDFLVADLQTSPSVWLIQQATALRQVLISDFDAKMDAETRLYTVSLEITPCAPFVSATQ
jgi:hypothetical protein